MTEKNNDFYFRPNTHDRNIFRGVNELNMYKIPDELGPDDVIVDVGAHIGSFAYTCLQRGAGKCIVFEANMANYMITKRNLKKYIEEGKVELIHGACWRSDIEGEMPSLPYWVSSDPLNTGGGGVLAHEYDDLDEYSMVPTEETPSYPLDAVLEKYDNIKILKLDCEGSEFPILYTSKLLDKVESICGEYHGWENRMKEGFYPRKDIRVQGEGKDFTIADLTLFLESKGFEVESKEASAEMNLGDFWAKRK